jgi:hypothetical protein
LGKVYVKVLSREVFDDKDFVDFLVDASLKFATIDINFLRARRPERTCLAVSVNPACVRIEQPARTPHRGVRVAAN